MTYSIRTVTHGTNNVGYSPIDGSVGVSDSTGVKTLALSTDQKSKDYYADGQIHMTLNSPKVLTIKQTNYQVSDDEKVQSGQVSVAGGGFVDSGSYPSFDLKRLITVHRSDGKDILQLDVLYNATSGSWSESDAEDEDSVNPKTYERTLTINGRVMQLNGVNQLVKQFTILRTESNASVFDLQSKKILTPSDFDPSNVAVDSVIATPSSVTVEVGKTVDFTYAVKPDNATDKKVNLSNNHNDIATFVDNNGTVTVTGVAVGSSEITLTSDDGAKTATVDIIVTASTGK